MMYYRQVHESSDYDEEGPFAVLKPESVRSLISNQSAHDSQNICNIRYQFDDGVWKPFDKELYLSKQTLYCQSSEFQENDLIIYKLKIQVEGFKSQDKKLMKRLNTIKTQQSQISELQPSFSCFSNREEESKTNFNYLDDEEIAKIQNFAMAQVQTQLSKSKSTDEIKEQPNQRKYFGMRKKFDDEEFQKYKAGLEEKYKKQVENKPVQESSTERTNEQEQNNLDYNHPSMQTAEQTKQTDFFPQLQLELNKISSHTELISNQNQEISVYQNNDEVQKLKTENARLKHKLQKFIRSQQQLFQIFLEEEWEGPYNSSFNDQIKAGKQDSEVKLRKSSIINSPLKLESQQSVTDTPHIIFAHADIMQMSDSNTKKILSPNEMLQADIMYDKILQTINKKGKQLTMKRVPLNYIELKNILTQKVKVFFMMCHGKKNKGKEFFALEDKKEPYLLDQVDEERLLQLFRTQIQCETIVISACYSSKLAEIILNKGDKNKNKITIVAINQQEKVLERAAQTFNEEFLHNLLSGQTVQSAFDQSLGVVRANKKNDCKVCCCNHEHKKDCLWLKYEKKYGSEKAHELHTTSCKCYLRVKEGACNDHSLDCKDYGKFYQELKKIDNEKFIKNCLLPNYLQLMPASNSNKRMIMCCCSSDLAHNEEQKFVLFGNKDKKVFDMVDYEAGQAIEKKADLSKITLPQESLRDFNHRNEEKIEIIQFLMATDERLLQIYGEKNDAIDTVVKAVKYTAEREIKYFKDGAFKIDLEGFNQIKQIMNLIYKKVKNNSEKDPKKSDVIEWFRKQSNENKSFLIIFDKFEQIAKPEVIKKMKQFILKLIEETKYMKIIILTKQEEFMGVKNISCWFKRIEWKPLSQEKLVNIMKGLLETNNKLACIQDIKNLQSHDIFSIPTIGIEEIHQIVQDLTLVNTLDKIFENEQTKIQKQNQNKDPATDLRNEAFKCNQILQNGESKIIANFIFFLAQIPRGLCTTDLVHLCILDPTTFGTDSDFFLNIASLQPKGVELQPVETTLLSKMKIKISQINPFSQKYPTEVIDPQKMSDIFEYFLEIEKNQESKFKVKESRRKALDYLLKISIQENKIKYETLKFYYKLAIKFLTLYGQKILGKIVEKKRKGDVDHMILTLHLDYGMWQIIQKEKRTKYENFFEEELDLVEERFNVIDGSFIPLLEDWDKIVQHLNTKKEKKKVLQNLLLLAKLIPSLLVEQGRIQDAIKLIQDGRQLESGLAKKQLQVGAIMTLIEVSLRINQEKKFEEDFDLLLQSLRNSKEQFKEQDLTIGIAESCYLEALLLRKQDSSIFQNINEEAQSVFQVENNQHQNNNLQNIEEFEQFPHQNQQVKTVDANHPLKVFNDSSLELMKLAIDQFKKVCTQNGNFGIAKSQLMYSQIGINKHFKDIQPEQKKFLYTMLGYAGGEFTKSGREKQKIICFLLKAKVLMAGNCQQTDRDNAIKYINKAESQSQQLQTKDLLLIEEILDFKGKILKEFRLHEGAINFFNFTKAFPIVQIDELNNVTSNIFPIQTKNARQSRKKFIKPFLTLDSKLRFHYAFDILTEDTIKSLIKNGTRIWHISQESDGSEGLCIERDNGIKHLLQVDDLKILLRENKGIEEKLKITLVVLVFPNSIDIAKVFLNEGVDYVIAFAPEQKDNKNSNEKDTVLAFEFNFIYEFVQEFYSNIQQQKSVQQSFDETSKSINEKFLRQCHINILDSILLPNQSETMKSIGIKPIFLQTQMNQEYIIFKDSGNAVNCSKQLGFLSGFPNNENDFFGNKKELFQVIKWVSDQIPLVLIKGKKQVGKTRFLDELGKQFYYRHKFPFKISYTDLLKVQSMAEFKDLMDQFDVDFKVSQQNKEQIESNRSMLWFFDNAHSLSQQLWDLIEPKLSKLCRKGNIYVVITSIEDNLVFKNFEEKSKNPKIMEMRKLTLSELSEDESIRLFLDISNPQILYQEINPDTVGLNLLKERVNIECKNLPGKIIQLAEQQLLRNFPQKKKSAVNIAESSTKDILRRGSSEFMAVAYGGITSVIKSISAWKEKSTEGFDAGADQTQHNGLAISVTKEETLEKDPRGQQLKQVTLQNAAEESKEKERLQKKKEEPQKKQNFLNNFTSWF